ncbi:hypothetical protein CTheo_8897 [Ceratobasidium theobromae]|uniref:P12 domain containing protein n=1 Tax=Ceratobasidium theobromae TaxID=1582974 RepID=A0A5N5Q848_9AGAM|nr:hypothetical protein CTheo_8897 [Ceratobasidium theobromae]
MVGPYIPFPINVTLSSPLFQLSPIASHNGSGWAPSCTTSDCLSASAWSNGAQNSTLELLFWGHDIAFDGNVRGDMQVQVTLDGNVVNWDPSGDVLFSIHGVDNLVQHMLSLRVANTAANAHLTINQVRINGSAFTDMIIPSVRWILPSNDSTFSYNGFVQHMSSPGLASTTTYISTSVGDKMSAKFNASAFVVYGPCGPSGGLIRVSTYTTQAIVNISTPFQADDCLLFQSQGMPSVSWHQLEIENMDGRQLGINRIEFFRTTTFSESEGRNATPWITVSSVVVAILVMVGIIIIYALLARSEETRTKIRKIFKLPR